MPGPKTRQLIDLLEELRGLLGELDHDHWANWMADCARYLEREDFRGITHLFDASGGMGSFNDILVERIGSPPDPREVRARELRSEAYRLADEIRQDAVTED